MQLIADTVGISIGSIKTILHEHLLTTKVCACWVPRMLDQKMKDCRCEASSENLKLMQLDWNLFLKRIITGDETWIHHYDPESKQQRTQWKHATSPSPRKFKVQASAGKVMCTIFWDAEGVLLIDFMPHKVTVTGFTTVTYFTNCFWQLKRSGEESCPRCRYFCTTMHLLIGGMLDRLHYLNPDLKKCAIQHIILMWHQVITIYFQI